MAEKKIYIGSVGPYLYDDANLIEDEDGDFPGKSYKAITSNGQMHLTQAPIDGEEIVRLEDLEFRLLPPASVANIDNPSELNTASGSLGALIIAYEINGATAQNEYTIYAYDASGPAVNSPYIVDAAGTGDERWVAIGGKYTAQNINLSGNITLTGTVDGTNISVHVANVNAHHAQLHTAASHSDISSTGANIDDAVSKRHTQGLDTSVGTLTTYADNAAAITGGLSAGDLYKTGGDPDLVCIVH